MKPNYQFNQSERFSRGRGSRGVSRFQRPIGRGRSMVASHPMNKKTVNISPAKKAVNITPENANTKAFKNIPPVMKGKKAKKQKSKTSNNYAPTAIISPKNFPSEVMSAEQLNMLENAILEAIDKMNEGPQPKRPQFLSSAKVNGTLTIECFKFKSMIWLSNTLKTLKLWENAQLRLVKRGEEFVTVILPKLYPKRLFSSAELIAVEDEILKTIDKIPPGSFVPKFISCDRKEHSLKVNCFNMESVQWLKTTLENLSWNGPQLSLFDVENVPIIYKVQLIIPGASVDKDLVLQRLIRQNKGININDWHFLFQAKDNNSHTIDMLVKQEDIDSLKKVGFKLFYNFEQIKIFHWKHFNPMKGISIKDNEKKIKDNECTTSSAQEIKNEVINVDAIDDDVIHIDDIEDLSDLLEKVGEIERDIAEQILSDQEN